MVCDDQLELPATATKHLSALDVSHFRLRQLADGVSNGTALWLGAQCLSFYLADTLPKPRPASPKTRPSVLELGSGIGYSALFLAAAGYDVLATDTSHVVSSVLARNIAFNTHNLPLTAGRILVRELDWTCIPQQWDWDSPVAIASSAPRSPTAMPSPSTPLRPPFDLIISSDTLYAPELVTPLLRSLHAVACQSYSPTAPRRSAPIYLCLERRDPALIDHALAEASSIWGFRVDRIPRRKIAKALDRAGVRWAAEDWEGIEIYRLTLRRDQQQ
ncbi:hypothetical protein K488DRAFT_59510 [Vararia minispora EC-137]|uniref:Uncharacterized protein n=1 Tax=Vararia minispora EC-137 TaxID=1314806 RepID=A0ACB8Q8K2_9AGAM|nr:hypothetical protein K488DRAFT_59510 [Vararia minispora EC-137]